MSRPSSESVRRILLVTLERAEVAAKRLQNPADSEALHDFRVALRRLRSLLRAFRAVVAEDLPGRAESRLRAIARATNRGRDFEVQAGLLREWLREPGDAHATLAARKAALELAADLERRRDELAAGSIASACAGFAALAANLRRRLTTYRVTVDLEAAASEVGVGSAPFGGEMARQIKNQVERFRRSAAAVTGIDPPEPLHRLRIDAKRLRYLLEPLREEVPELGVPLNALRSWQDLLGQFQDAVVLERRVAKRYAAAARHRIRALLEEARTHGSQDAAKRARRRVPVSPRGFLPLLDLARARQQRLWRRLGKKLLELPALEAKLERVGSQWSAGNPPAGSAPPPASAGEGP